MTEELEVIDTSSPDDEFYYSDKEPKRIIKFFEKLLCVTTDNGPQPFILAEFQKEIIRDVFGTYRKKSGLRRYKVVYIEIPRGNGKTYLTAGLCLYNLTASYDAEIIAAAKSRDQASRLLRDAAMMIENNKILKKNFRVLRSAILYKKTNSIFKVISRDANTALGGRMTFGCIDELLAQPDDLLYSSLKSSLTKRKNSILFLITTAGDNMGSMVADMHSYAEGVLDGTIKDTAFYAKIYGLKPGQDFMDPAVWKECNPGLGTIIDFDTFEIEAKSAAARPGTAWIFKARNLNMWFSGAQTWIKPSEWEACADPQLDIEEFLGSEAYLGLDMSSTSDLTCVTICFVREDKYYFFPYIFCPEETIDLRSSEDKVDYRKWVDEGWLRVTKGRRIVQDDILDLTAELAYKYNIKDVAFDRWKAEYLMQKLMQRGLEVYSFGQGFSSMSEPTKLFEILVMERRLVHNGNPVFAWAVNNTLIKLNDVGDYKPTKERSGKQKIDPVIASIMALGRAMLDETRGMNGVITMTNN